MRITDRKVAYDGHYKLSQLQVQDGDTTLKRERFEPGTAVAALIFNTQTQQYVLTRQYRVGPEKELVELAAGMVDGGEEPEEAVRREVQEELGYDIDYLEKIVRMLPSPGTSAEVITIFYAEVSNQSGQGGGLAEENEKIEPVYYRREELRKASFEDGKTLIAVQWAQLRDK
ncbi:NUDIX hydrolase [Hymenobacter taeanensis]|uniref:GDP-mannose pyrophosphatase n=1 Tax=Hymenobacter taeanensis TaxID=2735321 RepID=A0A6M6BP66_9BACT|nr:MULTISPECIES: NUDIX hydrolase [Hymenobacter]QJX48825.1 NUDIX hydrolase [Hymenobacter taeanensis]UOQ81661.1 NUDIX hydrolase [Hymenobacter sp. 5414T-23]